jgi:hypothetical protein
VGRAQKVIYERAILVSYALSHVFKCLYFIVAIMEQCRVGMGGYGLTELDEYASLLRLVVYPKGLIGFDCVGYDEHSKEIIELASRYAFNIEIYGRSGNWEWPLI